MKHSQLSQPDKEYWEHLYNHKQICESLVNEGTQISKAIFCGKVNHINNVHGPLSDETAYILLTSLNRSLYNYFLLQLNLSFTECCFNCRTHTCDVSDLGSILNAGYQIINAYAEQLSLSRTNYSHIEKACGYIKNHLSEELSLARVSAEVYLSKNHLCHIFRTLMGVSFGEYVKQARIQRARILLCTTDRSIDDVASECGFNSSTYFTTVFKKEMGTAPSIFRIEYSAYRSRRNRDEQTCKQP